MREAGGEFGQYLNPLTSSRSVEAPRPSRRLAMLGLTRRRGQANAGHKSYDFSLVTQILQFSQAFEVILLETAICEQPPLDARHRVADRCTLFPF